MAVIGNIVIGMKVSTSAFSKGLKSAAGGLSSFASTINSINPAILQFGANLVRQVAGPLSDVTKAAFDNIDVIGKAASRIGTTSQSLSQLQHSAGLSGASTEDLTKGLEKMVVTLGKAKEGDGVSKTLERLGLSAEELKNSDGVEAFKQIADGLTNIENPAEKAAAAVQIFGKGGLTLLNTLQAGSAGLEEMAAEADKFNLTFSDVDSANVQAANDAISKLWSQMLGIGNLIAVQLSPLITDLIDRWLVWSTTSISVSEVVSVGFSYVVKAIGVVLDVFHTLKLAFLGLQALVSKGIAFIVQGFGYLAKGIEWVVNKIPGMSANFGTFLEDMGTELHKLADEQFENLNDEFMAQTPSENLQDWFDSVRAKAKSAGTELKDTKSTVEELSDSFLKLTGEISDLESKLQLQIDTFGMSGNEVELFKLRQEGATDEMLANASALTKQLDAMEKAKELQEQLESDAKSVFESTRTPLEQFETEVSKLRTLFEKGLINEDTFSRGVNKAKESLEGDKPKFASAIELGSQQAREIILKQRFGVEPEDGMKKVERVGREQIARWDIAIPLLRQIAKPHEEVVVAV